MSLEHGNVWISNVDCTHIGYIVTNKEGYIV